MDESDDSGGLSMPSMVGLIKDVVVETDFSDITICCAILNIWLSRV